MKNRIKLEDGVYLNQIDTDKFKSNLITFYIVRQLNEEESTMNSLLPLVLRRGSKNYKNNLEIQKKLEELYGTKLGLSILTRGNKHVIRVAIQFVNDRYVEDENFLEEVLDLLYEIIFNPYLEDGVFSNAYVEQEKVNLRKRIERKINDKREYAIDRLINIMCKNESFSISNIGYIDDIDKINNKNLYEYYLKVLNESPMELFYIGEKNEYIQKYFSNKLNLNRDNLLEFKREDIITDVKEVKYKHENMNVNQGKVVLGYRTSIPYESELYNALLVANVIFGASSNSKLFLNVREKESLAYYIVSRVYKYQSIMIIDAGIDFDKYDRTLEIIDRELNNMKNGNITDDEINIAKSAIVSALNSSKDSIGSISEIEFGDLIVSDNRSLEEKIEDIKNVTKEDIIESTQNIILDTVYFMKNDNPNEVEK